MLRSVCIFSRISKRAMSTKSYLHLKNPDVRVVDVSWPIGIINWLRRSTSVGHKQIFTLHWRECQLNS